MGSKTEQKLLEAFGKQIANTRKSKQLTQQELAEKMRMSVVSIAYIETGKRWARPLTLHKLAKALNVPIAELFKGV